LDLVCALRTVATDVPINSAVLDGEIPASKKAKIA
jgi:hypothetical protein